jgi:hypothetical protein
MVVSILALMMDVDMVSMTFRVTLATAQISLEIKEAAGAWLT